MDAAHAARRARARPRDVARGDRERVVRRSVRGLGVDGRIARDRHGRRVLEGRGREGAVRRPTLARHRGAGHAARRREADERRLQPERARGASRPASSTALIFTRSASSRARTRRASSCFPSARRSSSTTGTCSACARRAASTTRPTTCSCPRRTRTWRRPRSRCAAATSIASASSVSRRCATRVGRAASAGACSTS